MSKISKEQQHKDEKKVLEQLLKDASQSIDMIGKACGFSRQKVWRIIKRLEEDATIWGQHAVINDEMLDLRSFFALIKKTDLPAADIADIIIKRDLDKLGAEIGVSVVDSIYVYGTYDWVIEFAAEDMKQANKFCEILRIMYKGYISKIDLLEQLFAIKKCGMLNPNKEDLIEHISLSI